MLQRKSFGLKLTCVLASLLGLGACEDKKSMEARSSWSDGAGAVQYAGNSFELEEQRNFFNLLFEGESYVTTWGDLDSYRSGSVAPSRVPYQDSWYPESRGGTNPQGNRALDVYDEAFHGGQKLAANWEAANHGDDVNWYGHCNGASAATTRYENPRHSVTRPRGCTRGRSGCTEFTPATIRALLAEISQNVAFKILGGRFCRDYTEEALKAKSRGSYTILDACDDINPASFHLALINYMGRMRQPLIHDEAAYDQIWNYPLMAYSYQAQGVTQSQAAALAGSPNASWVFNPQAQNWVKIDMTLSYRKFDSNYTGAGTTPPGMPEAVSYILELDRNGQVIGGEWIGDSRQSARHPDVLWMAFEPKTPIDDRLFANPHIDPSEVVKIWAESVDRNPLDPFPLQGETSRVLNYPTNQDLLEWAGHPQYVVTLDGRRSGAAFIENNKDMILHIETPDSGLKTSTAIEVVLNGSVVGDQALNNGTVDFRIKPRAGINILSLHWRTAAYRSSSLNRDLRFYAM